jgi:hypothetical protein
VLRPAPVNYFRGGSRLSGQVLLIGGASGVPMSSAVMAHLLNLAGPTQRGPTTGDG